MLTEREATAGLYFSRENKVSKFLVLLSGDFAFSLYVYTMYTVC